MAIIGDGILGRQISQVELPLCDSPLSKREAIQLEANLMQLLRFLGAPGDWGYKTKLGQLTLDLLAVRHEIHKATLQEEAR